MSSNEQQNEKELNDLLKKFDETSESPVVTEQQPATEKGNAEITKVVAEKIVVSLGSFSRMVARHTQVPEIELTDEDKKDLTDAIQPLVEMLVDYADYIKYLPLIAFVIGYGMRVSDGFKKKKQQQLPEKPAEKQPEKSTENPVKSEKSAENPEKPAEKQPETEKQPAENTEKPAETKPAENEKQPTEPAKSTENTEKPAEKPETEPEKSEIENEKPAEKPKEDPEKSASPYG